MAINAERKIKENEKENIEKNNIESNAKPECFVLMPFSDPEGYERGHFDRVYNDIFMPAIEAAGFKPFRSSNDKSSNLIQLEILKRLLESPIAICDLSTHNANVMFELGIRQAFDKPVVLVQELNTPEIFDISPIRFMQYRKQRIYHEVIEDQKCIKEALIETYKSSQEGTSINSIVRLLSIDEPAKIQNVKADPVLHAILNEFNSLRNELRYIRNDRLNDINSNQNQRYYDGMAERERCLMLIREIEASDDYQFISEIRESVVKQINEVSMRYNNDQRRSTKELKLLYNDLLEVCNSKLGLVDPSKYSITYKKAISND